MSRDDIDPPDTGDDTETNRQNGTIVGIGLLIAIVLIVWAVDAIQSATSSAPAPTATCTGSCHLFQLWECPTKKYMGLCGDFWTDCDPNRAHACLAANLDALPNFAATPRRNYSTAADIPRLALRPATP